MKILNSNIHNIAIWENNMGLICSPDKLEIRIFKVWINKWVGTVQICIHITKILTKSTQNQPISLIIKTRKLQKWHACIVSLFLRTATMLYCNVRKVRIIDKCYRHNKQAHHFREHDIIQMKTYSGLLPTSYIFFVPLKMTENQVQRYFQCYCIVEIIRFCQVKAP